MAAIAHGANTVTQDVDVCIAMNPKNVAGIGRAMTGLGAHWSRRPGPKLWFENTLDDLTQVENIYLSTDLGHIDFLGELPEVGPVDYAMQHSHWLQVVPELRCRVLDLDVLIACKRAANRPKDIGVIYELEALRASLKPPND